MKIEVCSHYAFDNAMKHTLHLNDDNVEDSNMAFISIIGTPACLTYYLDEGDTKHYFNNHENVLNLDFDDIGNDVIFNGNHFKTMTMEQAEKAVDFIDKMLDKGVTLFMIHCRAGMSRSQGVGAFIYYFYPGEFESDTLQPHPNKDVYAKLSRCYYKKYKPEYE
jgi:hypothetical protein